MQYLSAKEGPVSFIGAIRGRWERTQKTSRFCLFSGNSSLELRNTLYDLLGQDGFGLVKTNTNTNKIMGIAWEQQDGR